MLAVIRVAMGLVLLVGACGEGGGPCRSTSDCPGDRECSGPDDGPVCGIAPQQLCASDADCAGSVCHAVFDPCSPSGVGSECGPPCTDDGECTPGFRCNAFGACEPVPCDEGFACAPHEACEPEALAGATTVWARHHGCAVVDCQADADCGTGLACVNGFCQSGPGTCVVPMRVP